MALQVALHAVGHDSIACVRSIAKKSWVSLLACLLASSPLIMIAVQAMFLFDDMLRTPETCVQPSFVFRVFVAT
jgi:hypothetical protein